MGKAAVLNGWMFHGISFIIYVECQMPVGRWLFIWIIILFRLRRHLKNFHLFFFSRLPWFLHIAWHKIARRYFLFIRCRHHHHPTAVTLMSSLMPE